MKLFEHPDFEQDSRKTANTMRMTRSEMPRDAVNEHAA